MSSFTADQLACDTCTRPFYACDCKQGNGRLEQAARALHSNWDEVPNQHNVMMNGRAWARALLADAAVVTAEQLHSIREALTGGHTGHLSVEGQRKYLAALDIIDRATDGVTEAGHQTQSQRPPMSDSPP